MNNTVNRLKLDRGSCENLHKKLRFADPVFITPGIYMRLIIGVPGKIVQQESSRSYGALFLFLLFSETFDAMLYRATEQWAK